VQKFTSTQLADLRALFARAATNSITGTYLVDGSVTAAKLQAPLSGITALLVSQWNASYGWGDHALAGYLTGSSPAGGISSVMIASWNTAVAWGNHATAGYYTSTNVPRTRRTERVAAGAEATVTLGHTPLTGSSVLVTKLVPPATVSDVLREGAANDFTVAGNVITLVVPLNAGEVIQAFYTA